MKRMQGVDMLHVLDDFLFLSHSREGCKEALDTFLEMCTEIGVPIATEKTEGPSQILTFLGIELDTTTSEARLPKDKLQKGLGQIQSMKGRKKASLKQLQSLLGFLNFTTSVILPGKPFLRRIINLTKGLRKPFHEARLGKEVKNDLV